MENGKGEEVGRIAGEMLDQTKAVLHVEDCMKFLTWGNVAKFAATVITLVVFYVVYRVLKKVIKEKLLSKAKPHTAMIVGKILSYVFYVFLVMYILTINGVDLTAVWGAAGVAGVAIGFASQTSISNLISGIFLLAEKAMKLGDYISIGDTSGIVDSIGLLSVKVHSLDNQMIRIPNSTIITSNLVNYNSFPLRRFVFEVPVSYNSDMELALETMKKVPGRCPSVVQDPAPVVFFDGFDEAIVMKIAVWFRKEDFIQTKNEVYTAVVNLCRENSVEIPFVRYDINILNKSMPSGV